MSYLVLARKWRPQNFSDVAGQEHVVRTLTNAIELNRLHHAYLFTGTRGVGKTTIARILARCLNCDQGPTTTPCGQCSACQEIDKGSFIDLIEVDAASRTGVDSMRELLDNVQYAPSSGQYKIYLIDEVHMLSTSSFNALLKTLEEPPAHVKFLFATTNPQKIPLTILSRCLRLNLTRIPSEVISTYLKKLLECENIQYEEKALNEIVIGAQGSMRDALSLLDQAIAYGNGQLEISAVNSMLGLSSRDYVCQLMHCLIQRDAKKLIEIIDELYKNAVDFNSTINDFIDLLHQVALRQALPQGAVSPRFDSKDVDELAGLMTPEDVQLAYQIALGGKRDMGLVGDDKNAIEMTMLRILNFTPLQNNTTQKSTTTINNSETVQKTEPIPSPESTQVATNKNSYPLDKANQREGWEELIESMQLDAPLRELCYNSSLVVQSPERAELLMNESTAALCDNASKEIINKALNDATGLSVGLEIKVGSKIEQTPAHAKTEEEIKRQKEAQATIENNPGISLIKKEFNANIVPDSTRPIDTEN